MQRSLVSAAVLFSLSCQGVLLVSGELDNWRKEREERECTACLNHTPHEEDPEANLPKAIVTWLVTKGVSQHCMFELPGGGGGCMWRQVF